MTARLDSMEPLVDPERLAAWMDTEELERGAPLTVERITTGHSNEVFRITRGDRVFVLRRPPRTPLSPTAHDMAREFRWLSAMHGVFPLAPRPYLLCEDLEITGSVFYAMERRRGLVVRAEEPEALANPAARRRLSEAMIDTLADLHAIDVTTPPLSTLGKPAGFVERQVRGWSERWHRSKTSPLPEMDALAEWLRQHLPVDPPTPSIVHGDFKLDNVMLDPDDVGRLVAVFDWEMSALGDPLVDLGIVLTYWSPTAPPEQRDALTSVTDRPGFFTREEIVERYAARSGRDLSAIRYYEIFAVFKIAVVIQQIFYRYAQGQTTDRRFATFDARVAYLARHAARLAENPT
jgi:aminoglycoside phosphotransferase (APT) family kinase protein